MFVNGLPFFITKSRDIKLITVQFLPSRTVNRLVESLHAVMRVYRRGGFIVETCLMDMESTKIVDKVTEVIVSTTATREHVTDIERDIRTVKERARSTTSELPYKDCMPDIFIIKLVDSLLPCGSMLFLRSTGPLKNFCHKGNSNHAICGLRKTLPSKIWVLC
ncbi:hypothetical protein ACHAXN_001443 [Cyclotella atomus]